MNAEALIGTVLGSYTLQHILGQGSLEAVFLAQQSSPHRQVAVKVLDATSLAPDRREAVLERFRHQAEKAASLRHPHILPVYDYGQHDGLVYFVLPFIEGGTLHNALRAAKPFPFSMILNYLEQLASALDYAHGQGAAHLGLAPLNIFITPEGRLLLTDFGLARILEDGQSLQQRFATATIPAGALDYIAPEQVIGVAVDARADLYALGVILYQMVTGRLPFRGGTPQQVAAQHLQHAPISPRLLRPDLSLATEQVLLKALTKRPADRFACAQDMWNALSTALAETGEQRESVGYANDSTTASPSNGNSPASLIFSTRTQNTADVAQPVTQAGSEKGASSAIGKVARKSRPGRISLATDFVASSPQDGSLDTVSYGQEKQGATRATATATLVGSPLLEPTSASSKNATSALPPTMFVPSPPAEFSPLSRPMEQTDHREIAPSARSTSSLPPLLTRLGSRKGLLQPIDETSTLTALKSTTIDGGPSGARTAATTGTLPDVNATSISSSVSPAPAIKQAQDTQQETGEQSVVAEDASSTVAQVTGTLGSPTGELKAANTIKLKEAVKVVQVPVAGQPGRYVTGFLPVLPEQAATEEPTTPTPSTMPSLKRNLKKRWKIYASVALVLLLVLGSSSLLFSRQSPGKTAKTHIAAEKIVPDFIAIAMAQMTATARANTILIDPLNENIHNWPVAESGSDRYVFQDAAYHVTDNDFRHSTPAILPDINVAGPLGYTLTMEEIKGDDTSLNNSFGMILRFSIQSKGNRNVTTFYSFEVVNKKGGEYQFWKYDDGGKPSLSPWSSLWHHAFGKEFHWGHGPNSINTFKVVADGKNFTFYVNGVKVGTTQNASFTGGEVGMLVNLKGTEVAFSNLLLTYN